MRKEAERWLIQAEDELRDAKMLAEKGRYYLSLYLSQQSAGKALKALMYLHTKEPILTHSVSELISLASEIDPEFEKLKRAGRLDDYYIPTRYPNGLLGGVPSRYFTDEEEALEAIKLAERVIGLVKKFS